MNDSLSAHIYTGKIAIRTNGEDDDALYLDPESGAGEEPLAELVAEDIEKHGNTVTASYWITSEPLTAEELLENEAKKLAGAVDADYRQHYSEITGYLWTDAELNIGGHDLLAELASHEGSWCRLEVRFHGHSEASS